MQFLNVLVNIIWNGAHPKQRLRSRSSHIRPRYRRRFFKPHIQSLVDFQQALKTPPKVFIILILFQIFRVERPVLSWLGLPTQTNSRKIGRLSLFISVFRICLKLTRGRMWGLKNASILKWHQCRGTNLSQSFEEIEIDDNADYSIYLRQCHYRVEIVYPLPNPLFHSLAYLLTEKVLWYLTLRLIFAGL